MVPGMNLARVSGRRVGRRRWGGEEAGGCRPMVRRGCGSEAVVLWDGGRGSRGLGGSGMWWWCGQRGVGRLGRERGGEWGREVRSGGERDIVGGELRYVSIA